MVKNERKRREGRKRKEEKGKESRLGRGGDGIDDPQILDRVYALDVVRYTGLTFVFANCFCAICCNIRCSFSGASSR